MNTALQVKNMASALFNANSQLCSCVGQHELLPVQASVEKRIEEARDMKSRSKMANERLFQAISAATKALALSQVGAEFRRQRAHVS